MRENLRKFIKKTPFLLKAARIIKYGRFSQFRTRKKIKGEKNKIKVDISTRLNNCLFDIIGNNNEVSLGEFCQFNNFTFYIRGNNHKIQISNNVIFSRGGSIWMEDYNCEVNIGENSSFEDVHIAVTEPYSKIDIGDNCMFANGIDLRTGDSHSIIDTVTNKRINYAQNIRIGNHVWVASHVSILKGGNVMDNSLIATRSVVTKSFGMKNILIGGIPAKKIKENINWNRQRIYDH